MDGPGFGERQLPPHSVVLGLLACAALVLRRRAPTCVLGVTLALSVLELVLGTYSHAPAERHSSILMTSAFALFTVAIQTDRRTTVRVGLLTLAVATPAAMLLGQQPWYSQEQLGVFAWTALGAVTGEAIRNRRAMVDAIRERAERAERTREEEARRRVTEERMRIARELHDVVAHHIALVNVQAGVAAHVMDSRPDQAKEALSHIRQASRRALGELQTTVGLLRHQDEPIAPTEPARGLAVLDDLVEGFVRAGMSVTVDARLAEGPLPSAVDLAAYRVVQEALTNVHKHAGASASALVRLVRSGGAANETLDITVLDDGPDGPPGWSAADGPADPGTDAAREATDGAAEPAAEGSAGPAGAAGSEGAGGGHGLTGMRERAAALGGTCEAGPLDEGGFRISVRLPLQPPRPDEPVGRRDRGRCA
ncbi:histidine kinase [Streptomyces sp. B6B3]|uniref:sensor histidine kinase n=1 Tax=Streptomyces sp. B6B3 TaxID=3153570 RepID=UPI00325CF858